MNYKIKVNLGVSDCFSMLFIFLVITLICGIIGGVLGALIPIMLPITIAFYSLAVLLYSIKRILESITIIGEEQKENKNFSTQVNKETEKATSNFFNLKVEELEKIYITLAGKEEKERFVKALDDNKAVRERAKLFKELPDETLEELAETDMIAKYVLLKRNKKI